MTTATLLIMLAVNGQGPAGFEVRILGAEPAAGEVRAVATDGSSTVGDQTIPAGDWYSVRRASRPLPPWPRAPHAELTGGDRVAGTVADADGDALRLRLTLPVAGATVASPSRRCGPSG